MKNLALPTILVPIDFSDVTSRVIDTAVAFASKFQSRIVLLHIAEPEPEFVGFEPGPQTVRIAVAHDFKAEHQRLDELKNQVAAEGLDAMAFQIQGPLAEKILQQATEHEAALIVMGSHGHGAIYNLLVGSVTSGVLKSAKCPVVVVPSSKVE